MCSSFTGKACLFEHLADSILITAAKLSHFVTGHRSPVDAVKTTWQRILHGFIVSFLWNCCRNDNKMNRMYHIYVSLLTTKDNRVFQGDR